MKKILHIITSLSGGGAEKSLYKLITNGLENEFENYVICLSREAFYSEKLLKKNINVIHFNFEDNNFPLIQFIKLLKKVRQISPSLIQGWMYHGNFVALILSLITLKRIPVAINIRQALDTSRSLNLKTKLINKICAILSFLTIAIISNSKKALLDHQQIGYSKKNNHIISNGFDTNLLKNNPDKKVLDCLNIEKNDFVIGFIGRNHIQKNLKLLISVFNKIQERYKNIKLLCIGEGFDEVALHNKNPNIKYLRFKENITLWINSFDILCLPSLWEGFPNVIGEAMSCAIPCVASNVGECSYLIGNDNLIFQSGNKKELYKIIHNLYKLEKEELQKIGLNSRERIIKNFSLERSVSQYIKIYKKIIS